MSLLITPSFIQRIALFASTDVKKPIELALVNNSFREVMIDYSTATLCWNNICNINPKLNYSSNSNQCPYFRILRRLCYNIDHPTQYYKTLLKWVMPQMLEVHFSDYDTDEEGLPTLTRNRDVHLLECEQRKHSHSFTLEVRDLYGLLSILEAVQRKRWIVLGYLMDFVIEKIDASSSTSSSEDTAGTVLARKVLYHLLNITDDPQFFWFFAQQCNASNTNTLKLFLAKLKKLGEVAGHPELLGICILTPNLQRNDTSLLFNCCSIGKLNVVAHILNVISAEQFRKQLLEDTTSAGGEHLLDACFVHPGVHFYLVKLVLEKAEQLGFIQELMARKKYFNQYIKHYSGNRAFPSDKFSSDPTPMLLFKYAVKYGAFKDDDFEQEEYGSTTLPFNLLQRLTFNIATEMLKFAISYFSSKEAFERFIQINSKSTKKVDGFPQGHEEYMRPWQKEADYFEKCVEFRETKEKQLGI